MNSATNMSKDMIAMSALVQLTKITQKFGKDNAETTKKIGPERNKGNLTSFIAGLNDMTFVYENASADIKHLIQIMEKQLQESGLA